MCCIMLIIYIVYTIYMFIFIAALLLAGVDARTAEEARAAMGGGSVYAS